jgi:hypothetical protein
VGERGTIVAELPVLRQVRRAHHLFDVLFELS